jgi:DtxR family transcriptional regulator, Mn-dependent transcriptional regulator
MSESIEMYLLRVALLQRQGQPVPVPILAQELSISSVSANEMCRKLTDKGLIDYEPYKGVTLTIQGERLARQVLRCRRLWEVLFVEKLGLEPEGAEAIACRFEHVTSEELAERLATFLGHPTVSPQNEPIPPGSSIAAERPIRPLTMLTVGEQGQVVNIVADEVSKAFLRHQGVSPGVIAEVLTIGADGSLLLEISGQRLSLARAMAGNIDILLVTEAKRESSH